jgi:alpha-beta hydrolase superfamily lysophospholipase
VALDAVFAARFEAQRRAFWAALETGCGADAPVLLLHSSDDALAPEADVARFAAALRGRGRHVTVVSWARSPHVGHLREHAADYEDAAAAWMRDASRRWRDAHPGAHAAEHAALTARL